MVSGVRWWVIAAGLTLAGAPAWANDPTEPEEAPSVDEAVPVSAWEELDSGLRFRDEVVGSGEVASVGATVQVHYTGRLVDGTVFDSSLSRGEPFAFRLGAGRVIKGWDQGVDGMRVGGKRRLEVPPHLGYGDSSAGSIPPNSTLHFEVELLAVQAMAEVPDAPTVLSERSFRTTRSGLAWADIERGRGNKPKAGQLVCVAYAAWSAEGERVDDTRTKGECWTFRFRHDKVIEGLVEGVRTMREGGTRQLVIPAGLWAGEGPNDPIDPEGPVRVELRLVRAQR